MADDATVGRMIDPAEYFGIIEDYIRDGRTDGATVIPATPARTEAMIAAGGLPPETVLGTFPGRSELTVRALAENAVLAGCRPEYMPVLITACEIMLQPEFPTALFYDSTGSFHPMVVLNGPVRAEINVNCRPNVFGPGFRPNATIGRALRLVLINVAGARPKDGSDRSALGGAYRYTCVIGEDEENSPWEPYHVQQGFDVADSTVTVFAAWQPRGLTHQLSTKPEHLLRTYAEELSSATRFNLLDVDLPEGGDNPKAVLVLAEDHRRYLGVDAGWSKAKIAGFLHEVTQRRVGTLRAAGFRKDPRLTGLKDDAYVKLYSGPEDFIVIPAGSGGGRAMIGGAIYGATRKVRAARPFQPVQINQAPPQTIDDYAGIVERLMDQKSTDGWPVILPEGRSVERMVAASNREGSQTLGVAAWREAPITVRDLAINATMAGCLPEYMPALCVIYEMLFDKDSHEMGMAASTMGYNCWFAIHGPVAKTLGLNSGRGLFGPGARPNVAIGRAVRLGMMNLAGLKPDLVDRSCVGQAYKYGAVFTENQAADVWGPLHTTFGFQADQSAITMSWGAHPRLTLHDEAASPEELLTALAEDLSVIQYLDSPSARRPAGATESTASAGLNTLRGALVVLAEGHARLLHEAGWTRAQTQTFLSERARRTVGDARLKGYETSPSVRDEQEDQEIIRFYKPEFLHLLSAGGPGNATMTVSSRPQTRPL